jgi:pimeloyl-ACP methyl ester carboxylesterase
VLPSDNTVRKLAGLRTPTLYVCGIDDNFLKPERIGPVLKAAPTVQLRTVEDCGHLLTLEAPEVVVDAINEFLLRKA